MSSDIGAQVSAGHCFSPYIFTCARRFCGSVNCLKVHISHRRTRKLQTSILKKRKQEPKNLNKINDHSGLGNNLNITESGKLSLPLRRIPSTIKRVRESDLLSYMSVTGTMLCVCMFYNRRFKVVQIIDLCSRCSARSLISVTRFLVPISYAWRSS